MDKHDIFEVMTGKNLQPRKLPSKAFVQIWWRNKKLSRQAKVKRIQHHQTTFITNAEGTSPGRKHKRRKKAKQNKPQTIKKMVIRWYISIITLNVNGLNASTKRHRLAGWMKTCMYAFPLTTSLYLTPKTVRILYYLVSLLMFPLWLAIVTIFYFLSGYGLWKLKNTFYYCDCVSDYCYYVTIIGLISLYHD